LITVRERGARNNEMKKTLSKIPLLVDFYRFVSIRIRRLTQKRILLEYREQDLNDEYYNKIKSSDYSDFEHQIGRLTNWKKIIKNLSAIPGDIVEFGTWRGYSLLWICYLLERAAIFDRDIIGLDGFVGLPNAEGIFTKGGFADATLSGTRKNLLESKELYPLTKTRIKIEKVLFSDSERLNAILGDRKFCFIHIDCDVSSSAKNVFKAIEARMAPTCYVLFDDYGCDSDLSKTIDEWLGKMTEKGLKIKEHSGTKLTRNFLIER
jgi:hypothetical protein